MTSRRRRGDSRIILCVVIFLKSPFSISPLYETPPGGGVSPVLCISDMASASIITKSRPL